MISTYQCVILFLKIAGKNSGKHLGKSQVEWWETMGNVPENIECYGNYYYHHPTWYYDSLQKWSVVIPENRNKFNGRQRQSSDDTHVWYLKIAGKRNVPSTALSVTWDIQTSANCVDCTCQKDPHKSRWFFLHRSVGFSPHAVFFGCWEKGTRKCTKINPRTLLVRMFFQKDPNRNRTIIGSKSNMKSQRFREIKSIDLYMPTLSIGLRWTIASLPDLLGNQQVFHPWGKTSGWHGCASHPDRSSGFLSVYFLVRFTQGMDGNGWEWGNGIIIDSSHGSFPHSRSDALSIVSINHMFCKSPYRVWRVFSTAQTQLDPIRTLWNWMDEHPLRHGTEWHMDMHRWRKLHDVMGVPQECWIVFLNGTIPPRNWWFGATPISRNIQMIWPYWAIISSPLLTRPQDLRERSVRSQPSQAAKQGGFKQFQV